MIYYNFLLLVVVFYIRATLNYSVLNYHYYTIK
jgi:hypothetical protein